MHVGNDSEGVRDVAGSTVSSVGRPPEEMSIKYGHARQVRGGLRAGEGGPGQLAVGHREGTGHLGHRSEDMQRPGWRGGGGEV